MKYVVWLLLSSLLTTCTFGGSKQAASRTAAASKDLDKQAQVTLEIFSGRENPSWQLSEEQVNALLSILDALPSADARDLNDGLGYRGFTVNITDAASKEPRTLKVCKGVVLYRTGGVDKRLDDKDRRVEHLLLKSGGSHLDAGVRAVVEHEIEPPKP